MANFLSEADLIINPDGSVYHLHLRPEDVCPYVITVGDQHRVPMVSQYFDRIDKKVGHREFVTHIGELGGNRVMVISTGIGTDNVDVVMNELDALVNIDFGRRSIKDELTRLHVMRLGTSGACREDVPLDSMLVSRYALSLDGLYAYYLPLQGKVEMEVQRILRDADFGWPVQPFVTEGDLGLIQKFASDGRFATGITMTAAGFYAPQGRTVRVPNTMADTLRAMASWSGPYAITNIEMETAGIYLLGKVLGHSCVSVSAILANRITGLFSTQAEKTIDRMIRSSLDLLFA